MQGPQEGLLTKEQQTFTEAAAPSLARGAGDDIRGEKNTEIHCLCGVFLGLDYVGLHNVLEALRKL